MVIKKFLVIILLCCSQIYLIEPSQAENSNVVTVAIQELCRYRIVELETENFSPEQVIQRLKLEVLSNSTREWQLKAYPGNHHELEWSKDKQDWIPLNPEGVIVLSGNRSNWESHWLFLRYRTNANVSFQIGFTD